MKPQECESWLAGAEGTWAAIDKIQPRILNASSQRDAPKVARLRARLRLAVRKGLRTARYKARLLGVLADTFSAPRRRLAALRTGLRQAAKEGDTYERLLAAHSLAEFFVEERRSPKESRKWIRVASDLLRECPDDYYRKDLRRLKQEVENMPKPRR